MIWAYAVEQAAAIRERRVSAYELMERYLDRIEPWDQTLRSYVTVDTDGALAAARTADARVLSAERESLPPFHDVALSVKDVVDVAGMATTHSSRALVNNVAALDDGVVERHREAGFIVLGKTNVPEFCTSTTSSDLNGICRNPWDLERTPGGSRGGQRRLFRQVSALCPTVPMVPVRYVYLRHFAGWWD